MSVGWHRCSGAIRHLYVWGAAYHLLSSDLLHVRHSRQVAGT